MDVSRELQFQTARSSGKGGQHVNKVETAVIASFHVDRSGLLSPAQKEILHTKLAHRLSAEGYIQVRSQLHRTQLANKTDAIRKMNQLIQKALEKKKPRIATKVSRAAIEKRIGQKKRKSQLKAARRKPPAADL